MLLSALALVPFVAAYSVAVHRVLDVRLMASRALQYLLARYTLAGVTAVPFVLLGRHLYVGREESLARLLGGGAGAAFLLTGCVGVTLLAVRIPLLRTLDRVFFRERMALPVVLASVSQSLQDVATPARWPTACARRCRRAWPWTARRC